ncbi:MAG: DUF87 domain-containing protein [Myxococcales bacterium]|nr:DUF87 domain-containing protein [Myxococcales bacterium]
MTATSAVAGRGREIAGILLAALALFLLLSLASLQLGSGRLMGPCGAFVGMAVYALFGVSAYLAAGAIAVVAFSLLRGRTVSLRAGEVAGLLGGAASFAVLLHLALGDHRLRGYGAGGLFGEYAAELLVALVGHVGTILVAVMGLALSTVACTPLTMRGIGRSVAGFGRWSLGAVRRAAITVFPPPGEDDEEEDEAVPLLPLPTLHSQEIALVERKRPRHRPEDATQKTRAEEDTRRDVPVPLRVGAAPVAVAEPLPLDSRLALAPPLPTLAPAIIAPVERKTPPAMATVTREEPDFDAASYQLPDLSLLDFDDPTRGELDRQAMLDLAGRLEKTLADYGVFGRVSEIHPGPVVTMYEFQPKAGTKLSKISALSNDLAMALEALKVRIVAPIPGKAAVGIEVPNKVRETVYLKEIIGDESFARAKSKLTVALGKDIAGRPTCVDLAKMPHLLIAGTTGSGKSVSVNGMICSLLFNATPEEVKLIMIDPKMLELSIYEGIPHLLLPVVTDPKKANLALRWAVDEMERRYDLISKSGVRDIASYNKKLARLSDDTEVVVLPKPVQKKIKVFLSGAEGEREVEVEASEEAVEAAGGMVTTDVRDDISAARAAMQHADLARQQDEKPAKKLPYIVVIIDEFADLMMVASKEVETSVARIAQKARAAGIHLLLATQRPSVDVITGLIKANFPSRVALQVASKIDARTILDQQGAESLLGNGDMLFTDRGLALKRIHGPLVTDVEIRRLVDHLKAQGKPVYDLDILKPRADDSGEGEGPGDERTDEFYDQAIAVVAETRIASVSMIQRRLGVGYNRAAKMIERMERDGIVGPANGSKPREVLVQAHSAAS